MPASRRVADAHPVGLCTPAREHRNVSTVIDTNGVYDMMCIGLHRVGSGSAPGPRALDLLDLSRPTPGFVKLAKGMGGAACRVHSVKGLADTCRGAFIEAGPRLIDTVVR